MKQLRMVVFALLILVSFNLPLFAGEDVKYFSGYKLWHKLNEKVDIFIQPDLRFNDDAIFFNYYHIRSGIVYHTFKNLDSGLTYRYLQSRSQTADWKTENRIEIDLMPKINLGNFKLSDRSRFEYRQFNSTMDVWRYRNNVAVKTPFSLGRFELTPYISNEIYLDLETGTFNKDWATIGFSKPLRPDITLDLYYRVETIRIKEGEWDSNSIIGTGLSFKL